MKSAFLAFVLVGRLFAADPVLDRLKRAADAARVLNETGEHKDQSERLISLHSALRDWIESRLPHGEKVTPGSLSSFGDRLNEELDKVGLAAKAEPPDDDPAIEWPGYGYPSVEFEWLPELPNAAFVIASVSVPCGSEDIVLMYDIRGPRWALVLSDVPRDRYLHAADDVRVSPPDRDGNRLLLVHYQSSQCQSMWMGLAYSVYRTNADGDRAERLVSEDSGFYYGNENAPLYSLTASGLAVEFENYSVDLGILLRTHIRRYRFDTAVARLDPVALQPQDFMDEWLTRPWSEMQARSEPPLKEWHDRLRADSLRGDYLGVIPCASRPNRWLIDFQFDRSDEEQPHEREEIFFLIHDAGGFRYTMESVDSGKPDGCPGEGIKSRIGFASDKHPWLSQTELETIH